MMFDMLGSKSEQVGVQSCNTSNLQLTSDLEKALKKIQIHPLMTESNSLDISSSTTTPATETRNGCFVPQTITKNCYHHHHPIHHEKKSSNEASSSRPFSLSDGDDADDTCCCSNEASSSHPCWSVRVRSNRKTFLSPESSAIANSNTSHTNQFLLDNDNVSDDVNHYNNRPLYFLKVRELFLHNNNANHHHLYDQKVNNPSLQSNIISINKRLESKSKKRTSSDIESMDCIEMKNSIEIAKSKRVLQLVWEETCCEDLYTFDFIPISQTNLGNTKKRRRIDQQRK